MIEVYTQPNCPKCDATERWLQRRGIPYRERSARKYTDFLTLRLNAKQAPVVVVYTDTGAYERHWVGHKTHELETLTDNTADHALWEEGTDQ